MLLVLLCKFFLLIHSLPTQSIMAHCVHLTDEELETLVKDDTGVAHCPTSNICLISGLCPVRKLLSAGVKVGLGTGNFNIQMILA